MRRRARRALDALQMAVGHGLHAGRADVVGQPALPALKPTYGPFTEHLAAEAAREQLTREHFRFLNSQQGFLAIETSRDGSLWVVRHLGRPRLRDRVYRWFDLIPPLP